MQTHVPFLQFPLNVQSFGHMFSTIASTILFSTNVPFLKRLEFLTIFSSHSRIKIENVAIAKDLSPVACVVTADVSNVIRELVRK